MGVMEPEKTQAQSLAAKIVESGLSVVDRLRTIN